ncbi:unnamed protein product [Alopecurus aequalis]
MKWEPEQQRLGELGLAGVCLETLRVLLAILPDFESERYGHAFMLVAHVALCSHLFSRLVSGGVYSLLRLVFSPAFFLFLVHAVCVQIYNTMFVLSVGTLYRTKGMVRAGLVDITRDMRAQHHSTFFMAVAIFGGLLAVFGDAWRALRLIRAPGEIIVALQLLGSVAGLAGAAYIALVCQLACVVSVLEDTSGLGAMRRSRALLRGSKFWKAAAVLALLDGCFVAALMTLPTAPRDEAVGFGRALQEVAVTMGCGALCAVVVVVTLVAQPVVYLVLCDSAGKKDHRTATSVSRV